MDEALSLVLFLICGLIGVRIVFKWLTKKDFNFLRDKAWLKWVLSIVVGMLLGFFLVFVAIVVFVVHIVFKK